MSVFCLQFFCILLTVAYSALLHNNLRFKGRVTLLSSLQSEVCASSYAFNFMNNFIIIKFYCIKYEYRIQVQNFKVQKSQYMKCKKKNAWFSLKCRIKQYYKTMTFKHDLHVVSFAK